MLSARSVFARIALGTTAVLVGLGLWWGAYYELLDHEECC